ncbi:MAG TPA: DUF4835 family protein, partial [Chryseolinea sp.]
MQKRNNLAMISVQKSYQLILIILSFSVTVRAQELNCTVTINSTQIQTSDRGIFRDMKTAIEQFMNARKWSGDSYKPYEK